MNEARRRVAPLVWIVFAVLALVLIAGALLIALGDNVNRQNGGVQFIIDTAANLDLGIFSRDDGIFTFNGENAEAKSALVNWGIAAIVYLVVGKLLQRIVQP
ncbi:hypothetical protein KLP28_14950 [Nocardioidaceae bacterium]|nr:hypothetical protein KLP28_14950 [Nocardioidaceae bacterium]